MSVLLSDIINDYYDLLGDDPPTTATAQDLRLINRTVDEMCRRHKFGFARTTVSVSLVSNLASLASNFAYPYDLRYPQSSTQDDIIYKMVDFESKDNFITPAYWITGDFETNFAINSTISTYNPLQFTYYRRPNYLASNSDTTFFPSSEAIALGAYARKRRLDNPDLDTSADKLDAERAFRDLVSLDQRLNGRKGRYIGVQEAGGFRTGE